MGPRATTALLASLALLAAAGSAAAQARPPHIMVLVDTSGSMLFDIAGTFTGGDGSDSPYPRGGVGARCCPGWDGESSRMYIAKDVLRDVVWSTGTGEVVFGLARYWQEEHPGWSYCNRLTYSYYGHGDGCYTFAPSTTYWWGSLGEDRISFFGTLCSSSAQNTGNVIVGYDRFDLRRDELLSWIDNHEVSTTAGFTNPELRAVGATPLAGATLTLRDYFRDQINTLPPDQQPCQSFAVILTDGEQSTQCSGTPADAAALLAAQGVTVYVIAFAMGSAALTTMDAMAANGGTGYARRANSRDELRAAFAEILADAIQVEVCDGIDNDCDGEIDEDLYRPCETICGRGQEQCLLGVWDPETCTARRPVPEECNNFDDDCDGLVDEDLTRDCSNDCGPGTETCDRGVWVGCTAPSGSLEICDGIDNDCDGLVDESDPLIGVECGTSVGRCTVGSWQCVDGELVCDGLGPRPEECNGIDDDCNGLVDDGLVRPCVNADGCTGQERCVAGAWVDCDAPAARPEVCNGLDDDCDGVVDNVDPLPCSTACEDGTRSCVDGTWGACSARAPSVEVCDGIDNDCDGEIDEGVTRSCTVGACHGVEHCIGPDLWSECSATPVPEVCNNVDDDCDGVIDNDLVRHCSTVCGAGTQTCAAGVWGACTAPLPETEVCDGIDNDCNGLVDDGLVRSCSTICGFGDETCVDGHWVGCTARLPTDEICNGIDDDCDGLIDEYDPNVGEVCGTDVGECEPGLYECIDGVLECVGGVEPTEEICDGLDNNCNGEIDEGLALGEQCDEGTGLGNTGQCEWGHNRCIDGEVVCDGFVGPSDEVCDCIDNDCNGFVDDGLPVGELCGTDVGECEYGRLQCIDCEMVCVGGVGPRPEICDGLDNNCNGLVDEEGGDALCPEDEARCIEGECALPCGVGEFPCPAGKYCNEDGYCVGDPCSGVVCGECERCEPGTGECRGLCDGVECGPGTFCECGRCWPDDCYYRGCPDGQVCAAGECTDDLCAVVACEPGQFCRDGECFGVCGPEHECPDGQSCRDGSCVDDPCATVTCPPGHRCVPATGECSDACSGVSCPRGRVCDPTTGRCVDDPCIGIVCPEGSSCRDGACYAEGGGGDGGPGDGGVHQSLYVLATGAGGCSCRAASSRSEAPGALLLAAVAALGLARLRRRP